MTQADVILARDQELQLHRASFDQAEALDFAASVWPLAIEDPDQVRWADEFLQAMVAIRQ